MIKLVKVTDQSGHEVWINPAHVIAINVSADSVYMIDVEERCRVAKGEGAKLVERISWEIERAERSQGSEPL